MMGEVGMPLVQQLCTARDRTCQTIHHGICRLQSIPLCRQMPGYIPHGHYTLPHSPQDKMDNAGTNSQGLNTPRCGNGRAQSGDCMYLHHCRHATRVVDSCLTLDRGPSSWSSPVRHSHCHSCTGQSHSYKYHAHHTPGIYELHAMRNQSYC